MSNKIEESGNSRNVNVARNETEIFAVLIIILILAVEDD
jgi:hypothetical protein